MILQAATAAASNNTPKWTDVVTAVHNGIAAVAIILGAAFAYVRFIRKRVLHARCELDIAGQVTSVGQGLALKVDATVTNAGSLRLVFPRGTHQVVGFTAADEPMWHDAVTYGEVLWSEGWRTEQEMLIREGKREVGTILEPGESLKRSFVVPVPPAPWVAFRVDMRIEASPKLMWRTRTNATWATEYVMMTEIV